MKKISGRAFSVLIIAFMVIAGISYFVYKDYNEGGDWAKYFSAYNSSAEGEIIDTNGYILAYFNGNDMRYASDAITRTSNYHVTGDYWGRTGSGLIVKYYQASQDFNFFKGSTEKISGILQLSIDSDINNRAYSLLRKNGNGCIMICNYRTGEVVCMVSSPSIDPDEEIEEGQEIEDGTYLNKCLKATFTPGSTFKLVTTAAAIEKYPKALEKTYTCYGETEVAGVTITCTTAHGTQTFTEALANSCNCAFASIAVDIGQENLLEYASKYGFLDTHEINGITTAAGNFPKEFVGDPETAWAGIGQSTDLICPFSMLRFVSAIANDGELAEMSLVKGDEGECEKMVETSTAIKMQQLMKNNVATHYEGETLFPGLTLGAKTGTAEVGDGTSHSWFTGFLEDENHPYAFVALVENGGYGLWTAGLMMNELLQYITETN